MGGLDVLWNMRWGMKWSFTGCCVWIFVWGLQPLNEMEWLLGLWNGTTKPPMLCGAEVGEMSWTQCSIGWMRSEARTTSLETEWVKWMNLPQAHGNRSRYVNLYRNNKKLIESILKVKFISSNPLHWLDFIFKNNSLAINSKYGFVCFQKA